jgi:hypothetical protein
MPSLLHEALLQLFRDRPTLAAEILREAWGVEVPAGNRARVEESTLTQVVPTEYRADLVVLHGDSPPSFGLVIEAQLEVKPEKRFSWPLYAAALRARIRAPACVVVVTCDPAVADWAAAPIDTGQPGSPFRPLVLGPASVPVVTDAERAGGAPELAVLSALAHGQGERGLEIALATVAAVARLDSDRATFYNDLVLAALGKAAREALEALMFTGKYEYQSNFARHYFGQGKAQGIAEGIAEGKAEGMAEGIAEGKAEGKAQGIAEGKAQALLAVMAGRGWDIADEQRERILACRDIDVLDRWLTRVAAAEGVTDMLG